ncbi:MAG: ABC transporter permease [Acidobacteriota bacterium]
MLKRLFSSVGEGATVEWTIEPRREGLGVRLRELFRYHRVLRFFAVKTVVEMYQGTLLGKIWLLRPILPIAISAAVFGGILGVGSDGVPYFLFFLTGSAAWMLFEQATIWVTRSLDLNKGLVKKVYFPRLVMPLSSASPAVLYFCIFVVLLAIAFVYYFVTDGRLYLVIGPQLLAAVFAAACCVTLAVAVGLWTSVWQTRVREVRFTVRYVLRFWNYLTPVIYPLSKVPSEYRGWMMLNPMAAYVETFKWGVLGIGTLDIGSLVTALGVTGVMLVAGAWYFTREEAKAIDNL